MNKTILPIALAALTTSTAHAVYLPPMIVEITTNETNQEAYKVDDIDIELTKKDKVRAKNWNLSNSDYAKYKYVMEYMPRGTWTPELDPPIVLGNLAKTHKERMRYAKIMNELEQDRRLREVQFQGAGNEYIKVMLSREGYAYTNERKDPRQTGSVSKLLPKGKLELRSLYVDLNTCQSECIQWVREQTSKSPIKVKMDVYIKGANNLSEQTLRDHLGISNNVDPNRFVFSTDEALFDARVAGQKTPFLVQQNDHSTKVFHFGDD